MSHSFILQPYKGKNSRFTCPLCKQPHQFTRYIDIQSGYHVANHVGICNRATKCGYHYPPKQYFQDNELTAHIKKPVLPKSHQFKKLNAKIGLGDKVEAPPKPPDFINKHTFQKSLSNYDNNNLVKYLDTVLGKDLVDHMINIYKIGTSSQYGGESTIFWQIDTNWKIRTGKIIHYDPITGKRKKAPGQTANWVHYLQYGKDYNLQQCLFGEHLLKEDLSAPIAIVESEKTAIIAQAKMPDFLWMATGSLNEFKPSKLNVLKSRRVVAFPDLGAYDYWLKKASQLDFNIEVSDFLEKNATSGQRNEGLDIGDFL